MAVFLHGFQRAQELSVEAALANSNSDVIVIGAGISGLSCAQQLLKRGLKVTVLEAQSRVGGRILTVRDSGLRTPMELGAEFIHGTPRSTMGLFEAMGIPFYDGCDNHLFFQNGSLVEFPSYWDGMEKLMKRLNIQRSKDRSVKEFIEAQSKADGKVKASFLAFVEGFHSADALQISEKGLAESEQTDEDELNQTQMFRIPGGYDQLVQSVLHSFPPDQEILRLNTLVKKIKWSKGAVAITAKSPTGAALPEFRSKAVVITVPLGVLKAPPTAQAAFEFDPEPPQLADSLAGMKMGDVQRITFRFRTRFWDELSKEPVGFLHTGPEKYFPTWWTLMPMRTPLLVAWQGGPKANELAQWNEEERVKTALTTLSEMTGKSMSFLSENLHGWATHNWTMDPYFLGAYSYIVVDGLERSHRFTKPIANTIYFAGEATAASSLRGTVNGAFESGVRAAQQLLKKSAFSFASKK
jgi:monoamine oxidase